MAAGPHPQQLIDEPLADLLNTGEVEPHDPEALQAPPDPLASDREMNRTP